MLGCVFQALCRSSDLGGCSREYLDPTDAFVVGDNVRGKDCFSSLDIIITRTRANSMNINKCVL